MVIMNAAKKNVIMGFQIHEWFRSYMFGIISHQGTQFKEYKVSIFVR